MCGFELVNALESKLSNMVSNYLFIWYIGSNSSVVRKTDTLLIENFQTYSELDGNYTIKIEWHKTNSNFNATILNIKFKSKLALDITCFQCLGNHTVTISNCDFRDDTIGKDNFKLIMNYVFPFPYDDIRI